jgi:divalent metal cation (Fe/Co/Zn/Cd) transporter
MSGEAIALTHRHGRHIHSHAHTGRHRHLLFPRHSAAIHDHGHGHPDGHHPGHHHEHDARDHGHSHGLVDRSIVRSREGIKAVSISLAVLAIAAGMQAVIFVVSGSVALLADVIHNIGDALTAVPLGIAFYLRSYRGEKIAGLAVVLAIFVSACIALYESVQRLIHPEHLSHLWVLAAAGAIGFVGNEVAAHVRLHAGRRLSSPALVADGNHARADGLVSLGVIASAVVVSLGIQVADPIIGIAITLVILRITLQSWQTISTTEPGEMDEGQH